MNRVFRYCMLFVVVVAVPANAAVFERDWKTPGDGLLTYDDVNRREWLDLSQSVLFQFPSPFLEPALAELASGGRFEGFHLANGDDAIALAESAGIDTAGLTQNNAVPMNTLIDLLGFAEPPYSHRAIICCAPDIPEFQFESPIAYFTVIGPNPFTGIVEAGLRIFQRGGLITPSDGLMLYRPIPEPSSLVLLATAWAILRQQRRPKYRRSGAGRVE
jgi:hypothetical protein